MIIIKTRKWINGTSTREIPALIRLTSPHLRLTGGTLMHGPYTTAGQTAELRPAEYTEKAPAGYNPRQPGHSTYQFSLVLLRQSSHII